jgi:GPI ethanolamine phosphate transferase 3 subunit O
MVESVATIPHGRTPRCSGSSNRRSTPRQQLMIDAIVIVTALVGLFWFASSFFLARRSLPQESDCDEAESLLLHVLGLTKSEVEALLQQNGMLLSPSTTTTTTQNATRTTGRPRRAGCWMPRRVDSIILLVVDALRFDFAYYNLPQSIGKRLFEATTTTTAHNGSTSSNTSSSSRLFQFVADPPTVTMQRLKALTTGSLPTFADIGGNFGGATVEEDAWIRALSMIDARKRGLSVNTTRIAFVGDDTWEDLYPGTFTESFPYPSFNTRDLDTVDNGCLLHLPALLKRLRGLTTTPTTTITTDDDDEQQLELVVVHFLGVDHVGVGPHNEHMDGKLKQMDAALQNVLQVLDESNNCHAALILGDHGMTEDGNHGGGTVEETNAALFVHTSPACGGLSRHTEYLEQYEPSAWVAQSFATIHQIDLVPTIAIQLGLPIPFANIGGLVPSLLPGQDPRQTALALALNAAQVWRYFTAYSAQANRLPDLDQLGEKLVLAVEIYQVALASPADDEDTYRQVAGLFKSFLNDALELGQRAWTRFDDRGMMAGSVVLLLALLLYARDLLVTAIASTTTILRLANVWELSLSLVAMVFSCGALTFSNSYILEEENITMFFLSIIATAISFRLYCDPSRTKLWRGTLLLPLASRLSELFVSGHGLDFSISIHLAHSGLVFVGSLAILAAFRWFLFGRLRLLPSKWHAVADCVALAALGWSWVEKRALYPNSNGYLQAQLVLVLVGVGVMVSSGQAVLKYSSEATDRDQFFGRGLTVLAKLYIGILVVTGPATAASLVLYLFQISMIVQLAIGPTTTPTNSLVIATLIKLVTRHVFFATNHGCAFNRLQFSAAFVATEEFNFVTAGISLFLNTFGWEMAGIILAGLLSQSSSHQRELWKTYGTWQIVEALASCMSVSVLRRHLMVWDIYAPHFLFVAIFTVLNLLSQLTALAIAAVSS